MLASLPEAQYDHSEEDASSKKRGRPKKNPAETTKKNPSAKKTSSKKEAVKSNGEKQNPEKKNSGWGWNRKKRGRPTAASKNPPLKIIPLGGLGEIGKNLTVYEYENEIIIVDCGMAFPDDEMLGIDLVIPDFTYLEENKDKIKGLFITHGHEDHIGAVPYLLQKLNIPVFATRFSMALIENKLAEKNLLGSAKLNIVKPGDIVAAGVMSVEFIYVNHSIPDSCALAIHTPAGIVIQTGDYKVDYTPTRGGVIDLARFGELGSKGVLALLSDSTNAERPGATPSERVVGESFDVLFKNGAEKRIIVATFSSNVHRVQMVIDSAVKFGRKVAVSGRSMEQVVAKALELGYLEAPEGTVISLDVINRLPENEVCIVTTGSQGEPMSALTRMSTGDHKKVNITCRDLVIISAYPIPGNEKYVGKVVNELMKLGAEVVYEKYSQIHVSGHACQDEQKLMLALTKPQYFIPVHGEYKHLKKHSDLALQMGMPEENIVIPELGRVIEVSVNEITAVSTVTAGAVLVDGLGVGDVGNVVLRDRKHLGEDGIMVVSVTLSDKGAILAGPDILSRGFVYVKDSEELIEKTKEVVEKAVLSGIAENKRDWQNLKTKIRDAAGGYIYTVTQRSPMILPLINEIKEKDFNKEENQ
ncbi:MAG: ribonuclease J [Oscillospiraceae bacterium]|nr:ribonuclease J [Oscillospiraceae bacterium]MBQ4118326.1 ribonuclease J [Oscillospiraceae bacterium]